MKMSKSGRLHHRVNIVAPNATQADSGQEIAAWDKTIKADVPCEVLAVGGGETVKGLQIEAGVTTLVEMMFRTDVLTTHRLEFGTRNLGITRVVDKTGHRRRLFCLCKEVL